jgi:hypothetical protein
VVGDDDVAGDHAVEDEQSDVADAGEAEPGDVPGTDA